MAGFDSSSFWAVDPFQFCNTEKAVLLRLLTEVKKKSPEARVRLVDQAEARLKHLEQVRQVQGRLNDWAKRLNDWAKSESAPLKKPEQARAALIELVELPNRAGEQGIVKPNTVRINGTPVLVPAGESFLEIEDLDEGTPGERGGLIVRLRLFARQVVIGEA